MSLTHEVKDELTRLEVTHSGSRKVQLSSILRMCAELRRTRDGLAVEVEVASSALARYLRREIPALYGTPAVATTRTETGLRRGAKYMVRVDQGGTELALQSGLIDRRGRLTEGLPTMVVGGSPSEVAAAWRGAFLAAGTLTGTGKSSMLEVSCPTPEVAIGLSSCARRLGVNAQVRELRGVERVRIRESAEIGTLLTHMGALESRMSWERRKTQQRMQVLASRLVLLEEANQRRSEERAAAVSARVARALEILGDEAPEHLLYTGRLRMEHHGASLEELGQIADPPATKDSIAGRLRRLMALADKKAAELGIPDTESAEIEGTLASDCGDGIDIEALTGRVPEIPPEPGVLL